MSNNFFWPVLAYLAGSIPFGLLFARIKGVDLRGSGSGNIGATNVMRVMGKSAGFLTLLADLAKGFLPIVLLRLVGSGLSDPGILALTGLGAVIGHCYPLFLGFRGGKGVATSAGVLLAVCPSALCVAAAIFLIVARVTGFVSAGSLAAAAIAPAGVHFFCPSGPVELMAWAMAVLIWWKHKENIRRLLRGEEHGWKGPPTV
ncbi:MAG: glycerol-3-phosphate 1-O-acyltransferase PlsY [Dissulfurimicrobium sp.]|uniref:glycerol-3-phosphate 1-O-acyltransferase PlsY n=1 Tax=Dissulfurimicrobium sp. TaxID=2022436 RepID=UPI003D137EFA